MSRLKAGLSGTVELHKYDTATGKLIKRFAPRRNTITEAGLRRFVASLTRDQVSWSTGIYQLGVYEGSSRTVRLHQQSGVTKSLVFEDGLQGRPDTGNLIFTLTDGSSSTYDLSNGGSVRPTIGTSVPVEVATYTDVRDWGEKTSGQTWVFIWRLNMTFFSSSDGSWDGDVEKLLMARLAAQPLFFGLVPFNATQPFEINATDDESRASYDRAFTNMEAHRDDDTLVIRGELTAGTGGYTLRGERLAIGRPTGNGIIFTFSPDRLEAEDIYTAESGETLTIEHRIAFSDES